jgi:CDP-glucose 4,6-dehydratase
MKSNNSYWHKRPCLVTGGAGFGGAHLCAELLSRGAKVYVYDRHLPKDSYLVFKRLVDGVNFIQGDIRDLEYLKMVTTRFEIANIFHLAATEPPACLCFDRWLLWNFFLRGLD